jgi:glycyl-tRNA synthetase beta chain
MSTMTSKNLLVELVVEELPPKDLKKLGEAFAKNLADSLKAQALASNDAAVTWFASPRRLAVHVANVASSAADKAVSQKLMPVSVGLTADGQPTPALLKKLAAVGADASAVPSLKRQMDGKAEALFFDSTVKGATLAEGLQKAIDESLAKLPIPKVMQYQLDDGWTSVNFVRPAHGLVALHGADVVPIGVLGLQAGRTTQGHRFEAAKPTVELRDADGYAAQLRDEGAVIASFAERRAEIVRQLDAAATQQGLKPIADEALLDEVTALVERPNVLLCHFESEFLEVPQECLILTMKANQKYFPLLDAAGKLTNQFLIVSNIRPADPSRVIGGNERVVRPRLADAKFFFDQDRKKTLASRVPGLAKVVYHNKLGTQGERVERVRAIAKAIGAQLGGDAIAQQADLAAQLAKADLLTDMVGEFPELQGIMGAYYARHDGLGDEIAQAIEDHYKPRFAGDELPRNPTGIAVALADKLETIVGLFGIGQLPTGDRDPFALRRHALGIIRMLSEETIRVELRWLLKTSVGAFPGGLLQPLVTESGITVPLWTQVEFFIVERAAGYLRDQGYSPQEVEAVVHQSDPADYKTRLEAIRKARALFSAELSQLATADKRARNILSKSGGAAEVLATAVELLREEPERKLLSKTRLLRNQVDDLVTAGKFEAALLLTVQISEPVSAFFDNVMVNAEDMDVRRNRFRLLQEVIGLTNRVADLSKLAS